MYSLQWLRTWCIVRSMARKQEIISHCGVVTVQLNQLFYNNVCRTFHSTENLYERKINATAVKSRKPKSLRATPVPFLDMKLVKAIGGNGGDGAISFLRLWVNDRAGPDGGDGGNGGHVVFEVSEHVKDFQRISTVIQAEDGERGISKDCCGKNAQHTIIKVPIGTLVRSQNGKIIADLDKDKMMFIAARGGAGGHGNPFFASNTSQSPQVCEYGAIGEQRQYILELRSMAHIGLIGFPNAGKSTLLRAITRAKPKVAPYPFTTLRPYLGIVQYDDYEQVSVADLPGLIEDSHKNKGLGIMFLKHAERCAALMFILDVSLNEPWVYLELLKHELKQFSTKLCERPMIVVANKIDLPETEKNLKLLREHINVPIIPISAKMGTNVSTLLKEIRILYDDFVVNSNNSTDKVSS